MLRQILQSLRLVAGDLSGTLVFALLLALGASVVAATVAGLALAVALVAGSVALGRKAGALQWLSLVLIIASATATLATSDPRYVMAKPSVIALIVGIFMLRPGWLSRYMMSDIEPLVADVTWVFGFIWAGLMFATAALNLIVVLRFPEYWIAFLAVFPITSKLTLLALHFAVVIVIARRRRAAQPFVSEPALLGR